MSPESRLDGDGAEVGRKSPRKGESSQTLREVCLITAFGDWRSYDRAMQLGVAAYLTNPFRNKELLRAVHKALEDQGGSGIDEELGTSK